MKLARRPSAVIFDLDGVLLDTEPVYTRATQEVVGPYGKVFDWSIKGDMIGRSALEGARYLVSALELPISAEDYLERRKPWLERLFSEAPEMPGARRFVEALAAHCVPIAVATSSEAYLYHLKTADREWFGHFRVVVCGDDPRIVELKPAPDIFLVTAADLGVAPESCVVFEDSPAGVRAARAAGMQVVAMPDPHLDHGRFSAADFVIDGFDAISREDLGL